MRELGGVLWEAEEAVMALEFPILTLLENKC